MRRLFGTWTYVSASSMPCGLVSENLAIYQYNSHVTKGLSDRSEWILLRIAVAKWLNKTKLPQPNGICRIAT